MSSYESTGKTVEEAINEGLSKLGLSIGDVQVDILEEGSKGLFGLFGSKLAKVRLTVNEQDETDTRSIFADSLSAYDAARAPRPAQPEPAQRNNPVAPPTPTRADKKADAEPQERRQSARPAERKPRPEGKPAAPKDQGRPAADDEAPAPRVSRKRKPREPREAREAKPAKPVTPAEQRDPATVEGEVQGFLQQLTTLMGLTVSVHVHTDEEGNVRVSMEGDPLGILIGRRGETLDALQYLTSLHINRGREDYVRVTLDSEGYRAKREDALIRLANRMANRAQKTGRRVSMEPMNPYERRILHSALQNHPAVTTHSEGEEPNRHVVITLNQKGAASKPNQE